MNIARKIIYQDNEKSQEQWKAGTWEPNNITPPKGVFVPVVINNVTKNVNWILKWENEIWDPEVDEEEINEKITTYRDNKNSIIKDLLNDDMILFRFKDKVLQLIWIENKWWLVRVIPIPKIENFIQEVCCDILDYILEKYATQENDNELDFVVSRFFNTSPDFLDNLNNVKTYFDYVLRFSRSYVYANADVWNLYHRYLRSDNSWKNINKIFFEELEIQNFKKISDITSLIKIIMSLINFATEMWQYQVRNNLQLVLNWIKEKFWQYMLVKQLFKYDREMINDYLIENKLDFNNKEFAWNIYNQLRRVSYSISNDYAIWLDYNCSNPQYLYNHSNWKVKWSPIAYHTIFSELHNMTNSIDDNDEDYTFLIQLLHKPEIMAQIEHHLWISFKDYPFSIQPHFLKFLAYATKKDFKNIKFYLWHAPEIPDKHNRLRTFLATSQNRDFWDMIIDIDKTLVKLYWIQEGTRVWNELFGKYAQITEILEKEAADIQKEYFWEKSTLKFSRYDYVKNLIFKVNRLLEDIHKFLKKKDKPTLAEFESKMTEYNKELIQYWALFQISPKDNIKSIDEVTSELWIQKILKKWNKLSTEEKEIIWDFYEINYKEHPEWELILDFVKKWLEEDYENENADFYIFTHNNNSLLTIKFIKEPDWKIYFGAFNGNNQFQYNNFWKFILEKFLSQYKDKTVHWLVLKSSPHLLDYYAKFWFEPEKDANWELVVKVENWLEFYHIVKSN